MPIRSIAVIAAGVLGREVALLSARGGYATVLEDVNSRTLERAREFMRERVEEMILGGEMERAAEADFWARITCVPSVEEAVRSAELIIDTTLDELETKLEIFTIYDKFALPGAILGCCTDSLSVADVATITLRAERCLGLRFRADAGGVIRRVEIVRSAASDDGVVEECAEVGRRMGLEVVVISEDDAS
jgi:3-hydroxybutyryl-CoA dehydrogenase